MSHFYSSSWLITRDIHFDVKHVFDAIDADNSKISSDSLSKDSDHDDLTVPDKTGDWAIQTWTIDLTQKTHCQIVIIKMMYICKHLLETQRVEPGPDIGG